MIILPKKFDNNGTAAIEFAILLPFLLIMFFGAFEVSRYIMVVRKIENASSDIGFLLSREGTIHDVDGNGIIDADEDAGRIEAIADALVPMLMAPYDTDNYEVEIRAIARPKNATIAPDNARLMWSHKITKNAGAAKKAEVSPSSGFTLAGAKYSDNFGERADLTMEGQTFLLVNFAYGYDQVIKNFVNYVNLDFSNKAIEKISSYAVRSRWIDSNADLAIQANEFKNDMQICVNCNTYSSDNLGVAAGGACETDPAELALYPKTSGCAF